MRKDVDEFFNSLDEKKLIQINIDLSNSEYNGIIESVIQTLVDDYEVDPFYVTTILRNKVHEILSNRYVDLTLKKRKKK